MSSQQDLPPLELAKAFEQVPDIIRDLLHGQRSLDTWEHNPALLRRVSRRTEQVAASLRQMIDAVPMRTDMSDLEIRLATNAAMLYYGLLDGLRETLDRLATISVKIGQESAATVYADASMLVSRSIGAVSMQTSVLSQVIDHLRGSRRILPPLCRTLSDGVAIAEVEHQGAEHQGPAEVEHQGAEHQGPAEVEHQGAEHQGPADA